MIKILGALIGVVALLPCAAAGPPAPAASSTESVPVEKTSAKPVAKDKAGPFLKMRKRFARLIHPGRALSKSTPVAGPTAGPPNKPTAKGTSGAQSSPPTSAYAPVMPPRLAVGGNPKPAAWAATTAEGYRDQPVPRAPQRPFAKIGPIETSDPPLARLATPIFSDAPVAAPGRRDSLPPKGAAPGDAAILPALRPASPPPAPLRAPPREQGSETVLAPLRVADRASYRTPQGATIPELTAARIKSEEAGARARRAAVHYLGTVDSHYFPEAEEALLAALRCDRNEGVRLEAALALGNGLWSSRRTVQALQLAVSGSYADSNPAETSPRVKTAAAASLHKCLAHVDAKVLSQPAETPASQPYYGYKSGPADHKLQQIGHAPPSAEERRKTAEAVADAWRALAETVSAPEASSRSAASREGRTRTPFIRADSRVNAGTGSPAAPRQTAGKETEVDSLGLKPIGRIPAEQ